MSNITLGTTVIDTAKIPATNVAAMLSRGVRHYLGNEVSARVGAHFKRLAVEAFKSANPNATLGPDHRAEIEKAAIPATDSAEYTEAKATIFAEFLDTLYNGEVGAGSERGPTKDPFETKVAAIVKRDVLAILKSQKDADGKALWSGKKDPTEDTMIVFANGTTRAFSAIKAGYLAKNETKVHSEAKKALEAEAKAKANAEKISVEDLLG